MLSMMVTSSLFGNLAPDGVVDLVAQRRGLLDACTGAGAHVQLELTRVDGGEEILAQPRVQQGKGARSKDKKENEEDRAVGDASCRSP